jgi:hypothetical protein
VSRRPTRCGNEAQALPYRTDGVLNSNQSRAWRARLLVPPDGWCVLEPYHGFEFRIQRVPSQEIGRVGGSYCKYPGLRSRDVAMTDCETPPNTSHGTHDQRRYTTTQVVERCVVYVPLGTNSTGLRTLPHGVVSFWVSIAHASRLLPTHPPTDRRVHNARGFLWFLHDLPTYRRSGMETVRQGTSPLFTSHTHNTRTHSPQSSHS